MSRHENQKLIIAVVYVAAMFMAIMDTTIVNVALPAIGRDFHSQAESVGLVSIAYLVSLAVFIPASAWLGDRLGGRRALLGSLAVFTIGSALCGLCTTLGELVAFRVLQGAGGAIMTPVGLALLFRVYPPAERVRVSSILALVTGLAPALGPVLGGVFTTYVSWRLAFFVNVPIGVAAFLFGALWLNDHAQPRTAHLDIPGFVLSALGLGCAMYGVSEGPTQGWSSSPVLITIIAGLTLLVALVAVELRARNPLIALRLFTNRLFAGSTGLYALGSVAYLGGLYLAALFFQDALGQSAVQAGLLTFPAALGTIVGGQIVTRFLYWRFGPRRIVAVGFLLVAATMGLMAQVTLTTGLWLVGLIMFGLGLGISMVFISAQAASMATITTAQTGQASAIYNAAKQLGGSIGVALLTTVLAAAVPASHAARNLTGFHDGFLTAAAVALGAVAVALTIRDADAASTMIQRQPRRTANRAKEPGPRRHERPRHPTTLHRS